MAKKSPLKSIGGIMYAGDGDFRAENVSNSTATTVAGLREDFNALLARLKEAGLMEPDPDAEELTD